jgi:hypothetical protein
VISSNVEPSRVFNIRIYLPNTEKQPKIATHIQPLRPTMRFLLFSLLLFLPASSQAAEQKRPVPNIPPPTPVLCKTDATCDRDPKHLEAFVTGFYRWYLGLDLRRNAVPWNTPPTLEQKAQIDAIRHEKKQTMEEVMSPTFFAWVENLYKTEGGQEPNSRYCSVGGDPITCTQDYTDEWIDKISSKHMFLRNKHAEIRVFRPWEGGIQADHLNVSLVVVSGTWRIDAINDKKIK